MTATRADVWYGSEPPEGGGWEAAGAGRWLRVDAVATGHGNDDSANPGASRVAVVGGGPGGLFASYLINQRLPNARVTVFEACDRLGGKICTDEFDDGTPFEAGVAELYEYLGPGGRDPLRMLIEDDLGLDTVDISGGAVVLRDRLLRDMDEVEAVHGKDARDRIEAFHKCVAKLMPLKRYSQRWQPDNNHPWADKKFRECIEREVGDGEAGAVAREYVEAAVHSDLATESHTCNGLNGIKNVLMDNDEYMQVYHVVGGIGRVPEELSSKIRADVRTSCRVKCIRKEESGDAGRYCVSYLEVGEDSLEEKSDTFEAVVVCLPNHWLRTIKWSGKLCEAIHSVCAHYDLPAHYLRVSVLFGKKWWAKHDIPGEFWMMDMLNGCCCYDESTRWAKGNEEVGDVIDDEVTGHVLSFLIAGGDALLMCSSNQDDDCIVDYVMQSLPTFMRDAAEEHFLDAQVNRYVGSINAQPGGWPAEELRGEHSPEPEDHPGVFLVGDYFFDSTLNAALISASVAVDLLADYLGEELKDGTDAVKELDTRGQELSM